MSGNHPSPPPSPPPAQGNQDAADRLWWRDGVIYQIYPRSFMDANNDGIGDLEGIRKRLDHLAWLGVDGIWLSPCFPSPMADFGYDVSDYCDIDPVFGNLQDFDRLLAEAHSRGIRIILDLVPNHTSDRHPWFQAARRSRDDPKRNWYLWRDPKPDGSPPNNWTSVFGGPAWELDPQTEQYYLHTFLKEQPELNWRNPQVVDAMHDVVRFWFDRGVDGFRIDVIHAIAKDPELRDNPEVDGVQVREHSENHPDVHGMLRALRQLVNGYDQRMLVGEVYLMDPAKVATYYGRGDELHLAFNFSFMHSPWDAAAFRDQVQRFETLIPEQAWPNQVLSSHDARRHASRYEHPSLGDDRCRLAALMLLTLRGTPFLYYGEEIGMRNVSIPVSAMQDPLARTLGPRMCRDGERTPMQWQPGPGAGFTHGSPWLPLGADAETRNVSRQREDPASLLHLYRDAIALRRRHPVLHRGDFQALVAPEQVFVFQRRYGDSRALVALNFGATAVDPRLPAASVRGGLRTDPRLPLPEDAAALTLRPCEGAVLLTAC